MFMKVQHAWIKVYVSRLGMRWLIDVHASFGYMIDSEVFTLGCIHFGY